jgi:membrane-bound ClpP family serine protease
VRISSQEAAEAMVRDSASFTASEATDKHFVEWQVDSREALLKRLHGHELNFSDRKLRLETQGKGLVSLPLSYTELGAPGIGLSGIVGVINRS